MFVEQAVVSLLRSCYLAKDFSDYPEFLKAVRIAEKGRSLLSKTGNHYTITSLYDKHVQVLQHQ